MRETDKGLYVAGRLDLDSSEVAREVCRSMKRNRVSLSFGYLTTNSHKRADGVNEPREVDLFEVSIVSAPANQDTHFLSLKSAPTSSDLSEREQTEIERTTALIAQAFDYGWDHHTKAVPKPLKIASFDA